VFLSPEPALWAPARHTGRFKLVQKQLLLRLLQHSPRAHPSVLDQVFEVDSRCKPHICTQSVSCCDHLHQRSDTNQLRTEQAGKRMMLVFYVPSRQQYRNLDAAKLTSGAPLLPLSLPV
jgi:hypothetical protein